MIVGLITLAVLLVPGMLTTLALSFGKGIWPRLGVILVFAVVLLLFGVPILLIMRGDTSMPGPPVHRDGDPIAQAFFMMGLVVALLSAAIGTGVGLLVRRFVRRKPDVPAVF
jgi:hypothetical protein